jgi:uncharacterized protein (TIGR02453 family)
VPCWSAGFTTTQQKLIAALCRHPQIFFTNFVDYIKLLQRMLQASTIKFLKDLKKNNTKEWFEKNRKQYESAKEDFILLTTNILKGVAAFDSTIAHLTAKDCIFRINRDVRFSKDKSPYKSNMGMSISSTGKKGVAAGYYFHLEPGKSFVGGGLWMPMADDLKKLRQEVDYNFNGFDKIITSKKFKSLYGELEMSKETSLSRPPKGYDENNAAIQYLKLKSFIATAPIADSELADKNIEKKIITAFETLKPLIDFINRSFDL